MSRCDFTEVFCLKENLSFKFKIFHILFSKGALKFTQTFFGLSWPLCPWSNNTIWCIKISPFEPPLWVIVKLQSPTNPRVVTHQKEVFIRFDIWFLDLIHKTKTRWQPPWMVTHQPRMVTYQKDVYYRLGIWHLNLTHKTKTRWQLPWMVTYHL